MLRSGLFPKPSGERSSYEQFILFEIYVKAAPPVTQKEITWPIEPFCRRGNAKYGSEPGLKAYTHVSDQYAPFATQVIPVTVR